MKKRLNLFAAAMIVGSFTSCNLFCPKCPPQAGNESEEKAISAVEPDTEGQQLYDEAFIKSSYQNPFQLFGYIEGDKALPGSNISMEFNGKNVTYYTIGYDKKSAYFRSDAFDLRKMQGGHLADTVGIEIELSTVVYGGKTYKLIQIDTTNSGPYSQYAANVKLSSDLFDAKVSIGNNSPITGKNPAFIGSNDGRNNATKVGVGSYGILSFTNPSRKVRIHHLRSGGNDYITISSNYHYVPSERSYCLWDFRQKCWDKTFGTCRTSCK